MMAKHMAKKQRIVEAYCHRPVLSRKNPLGDKRKMKVAGGCILAISEYGKPVKYMGVGTVKVIPVSKNMIKGVVEGMRSRKRKR